MRDFQGVISGAKKGKRKKGLNVCSNQGSGVREDGWVELAKLTVWEESFPGLWAGRLQEAGGDRLHSLKRKAR